MANFEFPHLGGPARLSWMSTVLDSWKLGPGDLLVFVPWPIPQASYHSRLFGYFSLSPPG